MPFNTDNSTTPPITKYRRFLSTGMIQLRNGSFLWGLNMTHKCFNAVLSSSSQNGAQLFLCFPPSMLFGVKRLLPVDKQNRSFKSYRHRPTEGRYPHKFQDGWILIVKLPKHWLTHPPNENTTFQNPPNSNFYSKVTKTNDLPTQWKHGQISGWLN